MSLLFYFYDLRRRSGKPSHSCEVCKQTFVPDKDVCPYCGSKNIKELENKK